MDVFSGASWGDRFCCCSGEEVLILSWDVWCGEMDASVEVGDEVEVREGGGGVGCGDVLGDAASRGWEEQYACW